MRKILAFIMTVALLMSWALAVEPTNTDGAPSLKAPSAILVERASGTVLYEKNSHTQLNPASVTKVMTMLLTMEAIENGQLSFDTLLTVSEHAASMGGSQVFLEPGEQMSLHEAIKCIAVSSANDACVMVGEHIAGSEDAFVAKMNARAKELGMNDTNFVNCTGLDAQGHVTSAYDISLMSRELLSHEKIREYTTIWMDTIRDGTFGLSNTNKLVRFYNGATGLKTGFTSNAGYCVSASAMRDGMELIAVIMKSDTSANRNSDASALLNYGFAKYALYTPEISQGALLPITVTLGKEKTVTPIVGKVPAVLVEKSVLSKVEMSVERVEELTAPVDEGQTVGKCVVSLEGKTLTEFPLLASSGIEKKTVGDIYLDFISLIFMRNNVKTK